MRAGNARGRTGSRALVAIALLGGCSLRGLDDYQDRAAGSGSDASSTGGAGAAGAGGSGAAPAGGAAGSAGGVAGGGGVPEADAALDAPVTDALGEPCFMPATEGPRTAEYIRSDASIGVEPWTNPHAAAVTDASYAVASAGVASDSQMLVATQYGFQIPPGSVISGIEVSYRRFADLQGDDFSVSDKAVRIVKADIPGMADRSSLGQWPAGIQTVVYGSDTDLWGETWSPDEINANQFGVGLGVEFRAGPPDYAFAYVDSVTITVHYLAPC